jgi:hypothetical protein
MSKQQMVLTADSEQLKDVLDYIRVRNSFQKSGETAIDVHFVTTEELVEKVNDSVNSWHALQVLAKQRGFSN